MGTKPASLALAIGLISLSGVRSTLSTGQFGNLVQVTDNPPKVEANFLRPPLIFAKPRPAAVVVAPAAVQVVEVA